MNDAWKSVMAISCISSSCWFWGMKGLIFCHTLSESLLSRDTVMNEKSILASCEASRLSA